jgi:4a-hydroxytetrahydrobiopterin dehydratase
MNTPMDAPKARTALTATQVITRLTQLNGERAQGWRVIDGALEKSFDFADFHQTMAFVNAVAFMAHRQDHHPELLLSYGRCTVRWQTHDSAALSASDFLCAAKVDALLD